MGAPAPKAKANPKVEFPNPDQHVDLVILRKEMREAILGLRSQMRKGEDQNTLVEFASNLHPGSFADPARLPRDSKSRSKRKEECLFAAISAMVQRYWTVVLGADCQDNAEYIASIQAELLTLRNLKLDSSKVEGDDRKGYVLIR